MQLKLPCWIVGHKSPNWLVIRKRIFKNNGQVKYISSRYCTRCEEIVKDRNYKKSTL